MLQHYTHFNRHQNDSKNQLLCSTSHLANSLLQQGRPTSHVPPLPSVLCSNDPKLSSFSDSSMASFIRYRQQQQPGYHYGKQYDDVEQSQQQQTLSADEIQSLTAPTTPSLTSDNEDSSSNSDDLDDTSSLVDLSRRLRTNLTLAKQRMMMGLKQSTEPSDIAIYTQLESITLDDPSSSHSSLGSLPFPKSKSTSSSLTKSNISSPDAAASATLSRIVTTSTIISKTVGNGRNLFSYHTRCPTQSSSLSSKTLNKHRVHKKKPYNSSSSYMELQTNSNGYVSVVLRKKSSTSSKGSFGTLARSFSFNIRDGDDSESDSDSDYDDDNNNNSNKDKGNDDESGSPPSTPVFDHSCDDDTQMGDSTPSLHQLTIIAPGATTTTTTISGPDTLNPITWTSPPLTTTIGLNTYEQGMDWNTNMMETLSPTWMEDMEYAWQQQGNPFDKNKTMGLEQQPDENAIDSWLQRGGFGYGPLVAATDQELADLLDFD